MFIQGKANWAKLREDNRDFGSKEYPIEDGLYTLNLYPIPSDLKRLKDLNVDIKVDEEGEYVVPKRKHIIVNKETGEKSVIGPPKVVDKDAETPFTQDLGNGTVVNVNVEPIPYGVGKNKKNSLRLYGVQIVNHIPWVKGFQPIVDPQPEVTAEKDSPL